MVAFLGSFIQYVVQMIVLALIAVAGIFLGIQWRKRDNAKEAAAAAAEALEQPSEGGEE